jgi:hypothetical protein
MEVHLKFMELYRSPGLKWPGCEGNHSSISSAKDKIDGATSQINGAIPFPRVKEARV